MLTYLCLLSHFNVQSVYQTPLVRTVKRHVTANKEHATM